MGRREKLIESIRNNPKNVPFERIESLLLYYGCTVRQKKGGSSHYIFSHNALNYSLTIAKDRPIKAYAARDAITMIDDIKDALDDED